MSKTLEELFEARANLNQVKNAIFDIISTGDNSQSIDQMIEDGNKPQIIAAVAILNALENARELKRDGQIAAGKLKEPE